MTLAKPGYSKYARLLPATYFMLLGAGMLLSDLLSSHGFTWKQFIFMLFLSVPFCVRKLWVYLLAGICYNLVFGYIFIAAIVLWVRHISGAPYRNTALDYVRVFIFLIFSLVCAFSLIWRCIDHSGKNVTLKDRL